MIADDYAGLGVHEAARRAIAEGGEIRDGVDRVGRRDPFAFGQEREVTLKGLAEPVRVVAIDWSAPSPSRSRAWRRRRDLVHLARRQGRACSRNQRLTLRGLPTKTSEGWP